MRVVVDRVSKTYADRRGQTLEALRAVSVTVPGDLSSAAFPVIAALRAASGVSISKPDEVAKSYPGFFSDLESLRENSQ